MEQNQDSSLFGLGIDANSRTHLSEAARWAKFLSIVGFVLCGLIAIVGIFAGSILSSMSSTFDGGYGNSPMGMRGMGAMAGVLYVAIALLYFFPCLFLYRFATKMKAALASNDQQTLNTSFQNLKVMFRFVGILTIIVLAIYAIVFLMAIIAGASALGS